MCLFKKKENSQNKSIEESNLKYYTEMLDIMKNSWNKKTYLIYDLSELPKDKTFEDVYDMWVNKDVLLVETKKGEEQKSKIIHGF